MAIVIMFTSYAVVEMGVNTFYAPEPRGVATAPELG